ncbi:hypothetical protein [Cytobacillus gottheilii]|uniref:Uncharacterized protein n=1 Tax=Cytobacillus gottheilii TaxID=859144 RepID=A0ABX8FG82_9BACI|nr:hypothetical protein [Cytobacillus gottheilii]QVY63009.1 hypothetical protein J1899_08195 [Cytobacillus gottheilii]
MKDWLYYSIKLINEDGSSVYSAPYPMPFDFAIELGETTVGESKVFARFEIYEITEEESSNNIWLQESVESILRKASRKALYIDEKRKI